MNADNVAAGVLLARTLVVCLANPMRAAAGQAVARYEDSFCVLLEIVDRLMEGKQQDITVNSGASGCGR